MSYYCRTSLSCALHFLALFKKSNIIIIVFGLPVLHIGISEANKTPRSRIVNNVQASCLTRLFFSHAFNTYPSGPHRPCRRELEPSVQSRRNFTDRARWTPKCHGQKTPWNAFLLLKPLDRVCLAHYTIGQFTRSHSWINPSASNSITQLSRLTYLATGADNDMWR